MDQVHIQLQNLLSGDTDTDMYKKINRGFTPSTLEEHIDSKLVDKMFGVHNWKKGGRLKHPLKFNLGRAFARATSLGIGGHFHPDLYCSLDVTSLKNQLTAYDPKNSCFLENFNSNNYLSGTLSVPGFLPRTYLFQGRDISSQSFGVDFYFDEAGSLFMRFQEEQEIHYNIHLMGINSQRRSERAWINDLIS